MCLCLATLVCIRAVKKIIRYVKFLPVDVGRLVQREEGLRVEACFHDAQLKLRGRRTHGDVQFPEISGTEIQRQRNSVFSGIFGNITKIALTDTIKCEFSLPS